MPYVGDFILLFLFALLSLVKFEKYKFKKIDFIIFLYLFLVLFFIYDNFIFFDTLFRISEIRYVIYIPILFFFFRFSLTTKNTSLLVLNLLYLILKINLIICIIEFLFINFLPFSNNFISYVMTIFSEKDRIYDSIFGNLYKPVGLFPGSGNASIAISIFLLWSLKLQRSNLLFYFLIFFGLSITFTLTSLLIIITGLIFLFVKRIRFANLFILFSILFLLIYFSGQITNFRSSGIIDSDLEEVSFESATLVYQISFEKYVEKFSFLSHKFLYSEINDLKDLIGPTGEIYLLRVGIYFGNFVLFVYIIWLIYLIIKILKATEFSSKISFFMSFVLIISSFHYPSINGVPLYILLPLTTVLGLNIEKKRIYFKLSNDI